MSSRVVDVNCGTYCTWATTADGHVLAWGLNNYGQLALPGGFLFATLGRVGLPALRWLL